MRKEVYDSKHTRTLQTWAHIECFNFPGGFYDIVNLKIIIVN